MRAARSGAGTACWRRPLLQARRPPMGMGGCGTDTASRPSAPASARCMVRRRPPAPPDPCPMRSLRFGCARAGPHPESGGRRSCMPVLARRSP
eukprot:6786147-Lingulodinium_polyedra.AAC.1